MDRNLFLAIALSMLVVIDYYAFFPPPAPPPKPAESAASQKTPSSAGTARDAAGAAVPGVGPGGQPLLAEGERVIVVEPPNYTARIDRRGGQLVSLELKKYLVGIKHTDWGALLPFLRALIPKDQLDVKAP